MSTPEKRYDAAEHARRDLIHNEQIKLSASFLHWLAIMTVATGLIVPTVFTLAPQNETKALDVMIMALACLAASIVLQLLAQKILGLLR